MLCFGISLPIKDRAMVESSSESSPVLITKGTACSDSGSNVCDKAKIRHLTFAEIV